MESTACPKCGAARLAEALDCMTCGVIFARYKGPRMSAAPTPEPVTRVAPGLPANDEPVDFTEGVWKKGRNLVVSRLATIPDRCVSCNEPAETRLTRNLSWHKSWIYIFLLLNVLIYAVVALVARKTAKVEIPQCARHAKIRRFGVLGAWAFLGLGCLAAFLAADADADASTVPMVIFFGTVLVSLIGGFTISRPVVARRIDDEFVHLGKCSKAFLSSLPEAPSTL